MVQMKNFMVPGMNSMVKMKLRDSRDELHGSDKKLHGSKDELHVSDEKLHGLRVEFQGSDKTSRFKTNSG